MAVLSCVCVVSCATTKVSDSNTTVPTAKETKKNVFANNVGVDAIEQVIIDWDGKLEGEPATPAWIKTMKRGNAVAYCNEFGLQTKLGRKWLVPSAADSLISKDDGLIEARANSFAALGETISTDINSQLSSTISNGAKSNIRSVVTQSINTAVGMEYEGSFWQAVKTVDEFGNKSTVYHCYAFYSMDQDTYDTQLKAALISLLNKKDLSMDEVNGVAEATKRIMDKKQRESEAHEKSMEREQERILAEYKLQEQLAKEQTKQKQAEEITKQSVAKSEAKTEVADARSLASQTASANSRDSALAYLYGL